MNVYDDKSFKFSKQQDPVGQNGALGAHVHDLVVEAAEAGAGGSRLVFSPFSFCLCRDCRTSSNTAGLAPPQCTGNDQDSSTCGETPCQGMEGHLTTNIVPSS